MQPSIKDLYISGEYKAPLSSSIQNAYNALTETATSVPLQDWHTKNIEGTGGLISITDLIAYQIGWGKLLLSWYDAGTHDTMPIMPGEGFTKWDYTGLAKHFYTKYAYSSPYEQCVAFQQTVLAILAITEKEFASDNLEKIGVWDWCTLASGKEWPLSKWIQVNTVAPYRRARSVITKNKEA